MSGEKGRWEGGGEGQEYSYEEPVAGVPGGYGPRPPPRVAPGAGPPGQGPRPPPPRVAPGARPPGQGPRPPPPRAGPGYAKPQRQNPQYAPPGGYNAYPQQQQRPPPKVVYGVPPPNGGSYNGNQPVGAPPMQQQQQQGVMAPMGQWTTGLFDMGEDPLNCVITFFLPCITFGQIAEVVDQGTTSCVMAGSMWMAVLLCFGMPCFVSCLWRTKLRAKYNLPQDEVGDLCLHFWCEPCALCQEYRELNNRGINPSLGWEYHRQQLYAQSVQPAMGAPQQSYMQR